jgi:putative acetyltransferase
VVTIRAAEPDDAEDLAALFGCPGVLAGTLQIPFRSVERRRERLEQPQPGTHQLVAVVDDRVVGMLGLHVEQAPRRSHCASFGMAVHDDYQDRGIGSALMVAMLDLADNWLGLRRVELLVYTDNARAVHLYEKFGFQIEGTARGYALRGGVHVDAYYMARLRPAIGERGPVGTSALSGTKVGPPSPTATPAYSPGVTQASHGSPKSVI